MNTELSVKVEVDEITKMVCEPFDFEFNGEITFKLPRFDAPQRDNSWSIGLIVGPSGSGKTSLLKENYGENKKQEWNNSKSVASHFVDCDTAIKKLGAVGLNSIPSWCKPFHVLSNGEQFRVELARCLNTNSSIDEFTSVVDRNVAKSCSNSVQKFIRSEGLTGVVFSTCHYDVIEWLQPDWCYDTMSGSMLPRGCLQCRPQIRITVEPCDRRWWEIFRSNHYMTSSLNPTAITFLAKWEDKPVAFSSCLPMPSGTIKNAYREHRTVVLPDYQGLGIGVRFSDWVGKKFVDSGKRYFSKTSHPRMGGYRSNSILWKPTSKNKVTRKDINKKNYNGISDTYRINKFSYSHEYVGMKG